jgi:hypothetical protein
LPLTSALLPTETKLDTPRSRRVASCRMAIPRPPDCEANPMCPRTGLTGAKVAFMEIASAVLMMPMQFGPTMRMPYRCESETSSRSAAVPSGPVSAKPALITTSPPTPRSPQASTTPATGAAGTAMTARSTDSGSSDTEVHAVTPSISPPAG